MIRALSGRAPGSFACARRRRRSSARAAPATWAGVRRIKGRGIKGADQVRQGGHGYGQDAGEGAMSGDAAALWPRVAEGLRRDLGARTFDHWLKPVRFADYCTLSAVLTLETASRFSPHWLNTTFGIRLDTPWPKHLPPV